LRCPGVVFPALVKRDGWINEIYTTDQARFLYDQAKRFDTDVSIEIYGLGNCGKEYKIPDGTPIDAQFKFYFAVFELCNGK